jgi:hypothetical protein
MQLNGFLLLSGLAVSNAQIISDIVNAGNVAVSAVTGAFGT